MKKVIFISLIFFLFFVSAVNAQSISATNSTGHVKNSFYTNETVYVTSFGNILSNSSEVWVYITSDSDSWSEGTNLTSVSIARILLTTNSTGSLLTSPIWNPPLKVGKYDVVVDVGKDDKYNTSDFVDNTSAVGFEVVDVPVPSLAVSLGSASPSDHKFNASSGILDNIVMQLKLVGSGIGGSTERIKLDSIDLVASGTGNEKAGISIVKLIVDSNSNGAIDSEDLLIGYDKFISDNGILTLRVASDKKFIINLSTAHNLLIDYVMSAENYNDETYQLQIISVNAVGENSGQVAKTSGLPINTTITTIVGGKIKTVVKTCTDYKNQTSCPASCQWCSSDNSCRNSNETCPAAALPPPAQELPTETATKETTPGTPDYLIWIAIPAGILIAGLITYFVLRVRRKPKPVIAPAEEPSTTEQIILNF